MEGGLTARLFVCVNVFMCCMKPEIKVYYVLRRCSFLNRGQRRGRHETAGENMAGKDAKKTVMSTDVKSVACSKCGAKAGHACLPKSPGGRIMTHHARWAAFLAMRAKSRVAS
jgi:hypothetical protein